ncbi:tyrosine-type recombinase/integrase [Viridibacillus arvi]|uniref:tyrosine-type recombinase/integrase n=1 Tax=Viridibacillus arvi TaxID=263475 RepID=UPI00380595C8
MAKPKLIKTAKDKDLFWYKDSEGKKKFAYRYRYYNTLGERKEKSKQGFDTEKKALQALAKLKAQVLDGNLQQVENEDMTIAAWCDIWLEFKKSDWKPSTLILNKGAVKNHIKPMLGNQKLNQLDKITYKRIFIEPLFKKYKPLSVLSYHRTFVAMVNAAVDAEILQRNRFTNISFKDDEKEAENVISASQLNQLLSYAKTRNELQYTIIYLLAFTGIRCGEACGLTWKDVNFITGEVNINKTRDYLGVRSPKTRNSYRVLKVDDDVLEMLKKYKLTAKKTHLRFGHKFNEESYIFISSNFGRPINTTAISKAFRVASDRLGFKVKAHTLRHTYASLLISSGVDVVTVASRLGDTTEMVFKVYAHAVDENKNQTIKTFKNVLENN